MSSMLCVVAVERVDAAAEHVVEVREPLGVDVEHGHRGADAAGDLGRVEPDAAAQDYDVAARHSRNAAEEDAAPAEGFLEVLGALLNGEAAGDFAHGLQVRQVAVRPLDGLVGHGLHSISSRSWVRSWSAARWR